VEPLVLIDVDRCVGCFLCERACALARAIEVDMESRIATLVRPEDCTGCGACERACPYSCITVINEGVNVNERARITVSRVKRHMKKPVFVDPSVTLRNAAAKMSTLKIGSLIVGNRIVTETDLLEGWLSRGEEKIVEISKNAITIDCRKTVDEALMLMSEKDIGHLPVTDNESIVGMFSLRDALRTVSVTSFIKGDLRIIKADHSETVGKYAIRAPILNEANSVKAFRAMRKWRTKAILVENKGNIGIITLRDITNAMASGLSLYDPLKPRHVKVFSSEDKLHLAVGYMIQNELRHVPVIKSDEYQLLSVKEITSHSTWIHELLT